MKKQLGSFFLLCFTCLLTQVAFGQERDIPDSVLAHFKTTYPTAQVKDWDKERDGSYEVEFMLDDKEWEAYYAANGAWQRTERDVARAEVPQAIWSALSQSSYAAWKTDDMEEHQTPQHKSVFEIEVKNGGQKAYVYFLPDGTMVK